MSGAHRKHRDNSDYQSKMQITVLQSMNESKLAQGQSGQTFSGEVESVKSFLSRLRQADTSNTPLRPEVNQQSFKIRPV